MVFSLAMEQMTASWCRKGPHLGVPKREFRRVGEVTDGLACSAINMQAQSIPRCDVYTNPEFDEELTAWLRERLPE
jgi:hypothetical protein